MAICWFCQREYSGTPESHIIFECIRYYLFTGKNKHYGLQVMCYENKPTYSNVFYH